MNRKMLLTLLALPAFLFLATGCSTTKEVQVTKSEPTPTVVEKQVPVVVEKPVVVETPSRLTYVPGYWERTPGGYQWIPGYYR